jgi:hypothetical protein
MDVSHDRRKACGSELFQTSQVELKAARRSDKYMVVARLAASTVHFKLYSISDHGREVGGWVFVSRSALRRSELQAW